MKNLIHLALFAAPLLLAAPAQAINSELSLRMHDNAQFTLTFDNSYFATPSNTYNITNITPGMHRVRMTSAPAQFSNACGLPRLLFDGWVNVPENSRITAQAINLSQISIVSIVPLVQNNVQNVYYDPYNNTYGYGNGGYNNGYGYGNNNGYGYGGNTWNNTPVYYGMSDANFELLKASVRNQSFDDSKLTVAKQAIATNYLTSKQVLELVQLMTFESTKLDLAKHAYGRAADRNNYYLVSNAFTYASSIDDLSAYINNYHG